MECNFVGPDIHNCWNGVFPIELQITWALTNTLCALQTLEYAPSNLLLLDPLFLYCKYCQRIRRELKRMNTVVCGTRLEAGTYLQYHSKGFLPYNCMSPHSSTKCNIYFESVNLVCDWQTLWLRECGEYMILKSLNSGTLSLNMQRSACGQCSVQGGQRGIVVTPAHLSICLSIPQLVP